VKTSPRPARPRSRTDPAPLESLAGAVLEAAGDLEARRRELWETERLSPTSSARAAALGVDLGDFDGRPADLAWLAARARLDLAERRLNRELRRRGAAAVVVGCRILVDVGRSVDEGLDGRVLALDLSKVLGLPGPAS
jgi:hypothetical protein